jgi:hypothetical protein
VPLYVCTCYVEVFGSPQPQPAHKHAYWPPAVP